MSTRSSPLIDAVDGAWAVAETPWAAYAPTSWRSPAWLALRNITLSRRPRGPIDSLPRAPPWVGRRSTARQLSSFAAFRYLMREGGVREDPIFLSDQPQIAMPRSAAR